MPLYLFFEFYDDIIELKFNFVSFHRFLIIAC